MSQEASVILIGTDPSKPKGGIGAAMSGYFEALRSQKLLYLQVPTYRPGSLVGKFAPAVVALPHVLTAVFALRRRGLTPVVYGHAGAWPAIIREGFILLLAKLAGAKTLLQLHSLSVDKYLQCSLGRIMLSALAHSIDGFGVVTPWWKDRLDSCNLGTKVTAISNPMPEKCEQIARQKSYSPPPVEDQSAGLHIVTMTRLVDGKGVESVVRALAKLPAEFHLTIAGDGPLRVVLERLVRELGLEQRARLVGWLDDEDKHSLLEQADIFCLPSLNDSFGMVFVEAMAHGIPVVAVGWGPINDVVKDGETGVLIEGQDPQEVAAALLRLAAPEFRSRLSARAPQWVLDKFSTEAVGRLLTEWINTLTTADES